ncbi:phosphoribosylformylglycinamidine synthase I, partial [Candidatus Peregrinibacteria bacterium]|nr:phosphoribosylformylglycinamidine synthase I [Candidatus Peregrinibacteria bacterium]
MNNKKIAVISFPGTNNEIESIRAIERAGMDPMFFKWNDDIAKLADVDGYFIAGGFSYEDRGRAGMVAARDPLIEFIGKEAEAGKVIIGHCNGAQILIESGLIPLGNQLSMSLARNALGEESTGFLNEWIWITPACKNDRCAVSNWSGAMQMPIAHG